jgi:uncharacterized membrane protein
MDFAQFVTEYFVNPIEKPGEYAPYNIVNTIVFAIAALLAAYLIFRALKRFGVRVDEKFAFAVMPFAALGAIARVLSDAAVLPRKVEVAGIAAYPFITPGIYIVTFLLFAAALVLALKFSRDWQTTLGQAGIALSIVALLPLLPLFKEFTALAIVGGLVGVALAAYWVVGKMKAYPLTKFGWLVALGQGLDGAATFAGVSVFGYGEQHVLANAIFSAGSPFAFFALKIAFALAVAYAASREKDGDEKNFVMLLIAVMGFAPGLRDVLRVAAGV